MEKFFLIALFSIKNQKTFAQVMAKCLVDNPINYLQINHTCVQTGTITYENNRDTRHSEQTTI